MYEEITHYQFHIHCHDHQFTINETLVIIKDSHISVHISSIFTVMITINETLVIIKALKKETDLADAAFGIFLVITRFYLIDACF